MRASILFMLIFILALLLKINAFAQTNFSINFIKATIDGTSTLYDWQFEITQIDYKGIISGNSTSKVIRDIEIKIPVEGIKSKEGKIIDHKTYEAFLSDKNPQ